MQNLARIVSATALLATLAARAWAQPAPGASQPPMPSKQTVQSFSLTKSQTLAAKYLLFLPKGYQAGNPQRWPLILFLHGAGERGSDIWRVAVHGPPKQVMADAQLPFIVVSPQCPEGRIWSKEVLLALLDEVMGRYSVDPSRVYLTGLSMGGYGTWDLGLSYPERFAAIAPICGGGEMITLLLQTPEKTAALKSLGVWAFHGAKDTVVPLEESQRMVNLLKKAGVSDLKFTVYPEANHDSWTETYKNPDFYQWLLAHQRPKKG